MHKFYKKIDMYIIGDKDIFDKFVDSIPKIINFSDVDKNSQDSNIIKSIYYVENKYLKIGDYYFKSKPTILQLGSLVINRFFNEIKIYDQNDIKMLRILLNYFMIKQYLKKVIEVYLQDY